jgi:hypothetical protein
LGSKKSVNKATLGDIDLTTLQKRLLQRKIEVPFGHKQGQRRKKRGFLRALQPILLSFIRKRQKTSEDQTKQSHQHTSTHNKGTRQRANGLAHSQESATKREKEASYPINSCQKWC